MGDRQSQYHDDDRGGHTGEQAKPERLENEWVLQPAEQGARGDSEHEAQQGESEQQSQQRAEGYAYGRYRDAGELAASEWDGG
jgi:hypothetical protein